VLLLTITSNSNWYKVVLVLHILCAIVGFGAVYLNGIYGAEIRKRRGADAIAVYEANFRVSNIGQYFIYAVLLLGLALVGMSNKEWKFSQTWVWLSVVLFVVGLGLAHGVLRPAVKRMGVLMREVAAGPPATSGPPPQATDMASLGQRIAAAGVTLNLVVVVILVLMVFKPGAPGNGF
jgi:uncharacterized membrane protein